MYKKDPEHEPGNKVVSNVSRLFLLQFLLPTSCLSSQPGFPPWWVVIYKPTKHFPQYLAFGHCVYHRNIKQSRSLRLQGLLSVLRSYLNFFKFSGRTWPIEYIRKRIYLDYIILYRLDSPTIDVYKLERLRTQ